MSYFDKAFEAVVGIEAEYTPGIPGDPGGETKYGISKRAYPEVDIKNLTLEGAKALYLRDYWYPSGCEHMPWDLAVCALDCAINQGEHAEELLMHHSSDAQEFMTQRALRYAASANVGRFGHSWFHRLFVIHKAAQRLL
jgi:lysozyme family protein